MKSRTPVTMLAFMVVGMTMYSCQKSDTLGSAPSTSADSTTTSGDVTVSASLRDSTSGDSTTFYQDCGQGGSLDSIAIELLPDAVAAYLDTAYAGYTLQKAFEVKDSSDVVTAYAVIIYVDDKPIGLRFDEEGNFEGLLERGRHHGRRGSGM